MTIEEKIAWAEDCLASHGALLLSDPKLGQLLEAFKGARAASHLEMQKAGIGEICHKCETQGGGSCCGAGIEQRYDQWILVANLLLGVSIPKSRWNRDSCLFLGPEGCVLLARHTICVDYLCKDLVNQVDPRCISRLREKEGKELELLFFICERINEVIKEGEQAR